MKRRNLIPFAELPIDPVYLALKQATGKYGGSTTGSRRGSSAHPIDSHSPSPSTLSRVSLQDSGYVEMPKANPLLGSTPQLDHAGRAPAKRRAPKLTQQMKSLSLDCAEVPPRVQGVSRSPMSRETNKLSARDTTSSTGRLKNGSSDLSDWERSCSPQVNSSRRASAQTLASQGGHIVIHEYTPSAGQTLILGERLIVVNNGDPDWLHGFRLSDRTEQLVSFPATCVGKVLAGEQPMKITQNVCIPEIKLRLYRDQVVFAQPDSIREGNKVIIRTERDVFTACRLEFLSLL
ncbi:unnamed protein product, partial [Mesorhabditis belari]|uniref:STAC3-related SH3 domain-containing protein n=1 Tax=Mesorhabditis belari TaxID=2138241 RepID=A0AAF3FLE9_9BILA